MSTQPKKEILDYDFPQGISLIEANAGTGKTFSIELIYLKALLELKLEVQQILLVTFTVEATQQMKKRIFEVLQRCSDFFDNKKQTPYFPLNNSSATMSFSKPSFNLLAVPIVALIKDSLFTRAAKLTVYFE